MINQTNVNYGTTRSAIRELFEYGKKRKAEIGEENVFDFSLGNPSVPAPREVKDELIKLITGTDPVALHGYTSAQGDFSVRKAIADDLNSRFKTGLNADCIYMTCGAAASICITLNALLNAGDEVITFAPFFPEYAVFTAHAGGELKAVECDKNFQPDIKKFIAALTEKTKAVIINSPNNPSGVVYGEEVIKALCAALEEHEKKTGKRVYLISDEPYRELVFDGTYVPFIMNHYKNSVVCYSFSKSLSLPGERIGYIAVNNAADDFKTVYAGVCGAGRALGYVCAPALFQQLVKSVLKKTADISVYRANRDRLSAALTEYGFEVVKPDGAFYLFVKSPEADATAFAERAKAHELLIVPADSFGVRGYVRISYCVSPAVIERALPAFKALAEEYR
ncbi:MAG: pyridoxal phosphate-dependent aminotransferase [Clostridiales bacterium]|nr:pyridoxal phosphate-dependent aminotransferase [Clostridiales bacterium]